jgi:hypothetical protein
MASNPAVEVAKSLATREKETIIETQYGASLRVVPVSPSLLDEVSSRIKDPQVPMWHNPDKDRDEPNPNDPNYLAEIEEAKRKRGVAMIDAMVMFGAELVGGLPNDDRWLKKLQFLAKRGQLDLEGYDLSDELDLEFLFKRFIALDNEALMEVTKASGMVSEEVTQAEATFRSSEER